MHGAHLRILGLRRLSKGSATSFAKGFAEGFAKGFATIVLIYNMCNVLVYVLISVYIF